MIKNTFILLAACALSTSCTSKKPDPIPNKTQEGTADVLSAPRVTNKDGSEAIIRVVEVHRYPQDWDIERGSKTSPIIKPEDKKNCELVKTPIEVEAINDVQSETNKLSNTEQLK